MGCCENVIIYIFISYKQNRICGGEENLAEPNNPLEIKDDNISNSYIDLNNNNSQINIGSYKNTLNNENLATLDSGSNTQRHYDENIENKYTIHTNRKYLDISNQEIKEEDEYNNSYTSQNKNSNKNSYINSSKKDIHFSQEINQQFTFDKKLNEESSHVEQSQSIKGNIPLDDNSSNMKKSQRKKMSILLTEEEFNNKINEYTEKRSNRNKNKKKPLVNPQYNEIDLNNNKSKVNDNIINNKNNNNYIFNYNSFNRNLNERIKSIKNKQKAASVDNKNKKSYFIEDRGNLK